jgi:hypothetical protein
VVSVQQALTILTSSPTMPSNNSAPVTISAIVQNASNQLVPGVAVSFQASSGAITAVATTAGGAASPAVPAGTTDANGLVQATLSTPGNPQNRAITVTVTAGSSTGTIQVKVGGSQLSLSGPASLVLAAQGSYSILLADSGGAGIANQTVALTSALGNTLTPGSVTTDATGAATFTLTAANSGTDTIGATWAGLAAPPLSVAVSNQNFTITVAAPVAPATIDVTTTTPPPSPPSLYSAAVTLSWTASGVGQSGTVNLSTSRGTLTPSTFTVTNGAFSPASATLSSTTAGPAYISATALNSSGQIVATTQTSVTFVATVPSTVAVQANPSTVPINGQSTITATVTDANGNPVQGVQVDFTLLVDPTGGALSTNSAETSVQGQATVTYTATSTASANGGVTIQAVLDKYQSIASTTKLTVGGQASSLVWATGLLISTANNTQYVLPYTITANDAAGNGVGNVTATISVTSISYATGVYKYSTVAPETSPQWNPVIAAGNDPTDPLFVPVIGGCSPVSVYEQNGLIQTGNTSEPNGYTFPSTWIYTAIPGNVAVTANSATTASNGSATVNVTYPQNYAGWVAVALTATADVQGTQNSTTTSFLLPTPQSAITATASPPFQFSPFGVATSCYATQPSN